jgi:hypothetical protein
MKNKSIDEVQDWELGINSSVVSVASTVVAILLVFACFTIYRYLKALLYECCL